MAGRVEFNVQSIIVRLKVASDRLDNLLPVFQDIGEYLVKSTKERFRLGVDPEGNAWARKKPSTIARYLANKDGNRPDPLIGPTKRLSTEITPIATRDGVEVGSSLEYSGVMQEGAAKGAFGTNSRGSPIPWGTIPARVWLGLSDRDERNILDIVDEHLGEAFDE